MFIVVSCSLLALLLTYLESRFMLKGGMKWGFILVTLLAVIHYDYGNDYMAYYDVYKRISGFTDIGRVIASDFFRETGWTIINYLFKYLGGFFSLVAVISAFQGVVFHNAIRKLVPSNYWTLGVFIYLASTSLYLLNFSMLRQGFVIALFVSLWPLIENRKWWIVVPILYLSSFIHESALVLIPFAFFGFFPVKNGKALAVLFVIVLFSLYFSARLLERIPQLVFESTDTFERYEDVYSESDLTTHFGVGFFMYLIPTIVSIVYLGRKDASDESKRIVALSCFAAFFTPLSQVIPMIGRVAMYFSVYRIIALPYAYGSIKNRPLRYILIGLFCAIHLFDYYKFFRSEVFGPYYATFHTIFGHLG